jgi:DNA/RNA-binding domain of Phe-tRNA-synthetase-like protein
LVDLCNAVSTAFAVPIAVFDVAKLAGFLEVRCADGSETYLAFSGEVERPEPREVIFADEEGRAHARRWTNRQSALSAVRDDTHAALIVAEALHGSAGDDMERLAATLTEEIARAWPVVPEVRTLSASSPRFEP